MYKNEPQVENHKPLVTRNGSSAITRKIVKGIFIINKIIAIIITKRLTISMQAPPVYI